MRGLADQLRLLFNQRAQLIKGIKRQKLNTAAAIDLRPAQLLFGMAHQALGAGVAIGNRQADALTRFIQQDIIHAPGIDADAVDQDALFADLLQTAANFPFQAIEIPAVEAIHLLQAIGKTVNFTQRQRLLTGLITGEHHPPAGGA